MISYRKKERNKRKEERKKDERADRDRSPSTIARTGHFCQSRAWKPLTPTGGCEPASLDSHWASRAQGLVLRVLLLTVPRRCSVTSCKSSLSPAESPLYSPRSRSALLFHQLSVGSFHSCHLPFSRGLLWTACPRFTRRCSFVFFSCGPHGTPRAARHGTPWLPR